MCFLLTSSCVWLLKNSCTTYCPTKKGMHNLKVRKKLVAPENCPTPPPSKKRMVHPCSCDENWRIRLPGPSHRIISRICVSILYLSTQWPLEVTSGIYPGKLKAHVCVHIYLSTQSRLAATSVIYSRKSKAFFDQNAFRLHGCILIKPCHREGKRVSSEHSRERRLCQYRV